MTASELLSEVLNINGLVGARELKLFEVQIKVDKLSFPYTGLKENNYRNCINVMSTKGYREYNLLELLLRLKMLCRRNSNYFRKLIFVVDNLPYDVQSVYIDSKNYRFILNAY